MRAFLVVTCAFAAACLPDAYCEQDGDCAAGNTCQENACRRAPGTALPSSSSAAAPVSSSQDSATSMPLPSSSASAASSATSTSTSGPASSATSIASSLEPASSSESGTSSSVFSSSAEPPSSSQWHPSPLVADSHAVLLMHMDAPGGVELPSRAPSLERLWHFDEQTWEGEGSDVVDELGLSPARVQGDAVSAPGSFFGASAFFDGARDAVVTRDAPVSASFTFETWASARVNQQATIAPVAGQWHRRALLSDDAVEVVELAPAMGDKGWVGPVFDGRYVYYPPNQDPSTGHWHGLVVRLDTTLPTSDPARIERFDTGAAPLGVRGFSGATFDGRYVYFCPYRDDAAFHHKVVRYDTTKPFSMASSWAVQDWSMLAPAAAATYTAGPFDGRYVHFIPFLTGSAGNGIALRYDTTKALNDINAWSTKDVAAAVGAAGFLGAVFDGQFLYFVPYWNGAAHAKVVRLDARADFSADASWSLFDMAPMVTGYGGFYGGTFDGRWVYFAPFQIAANAYHGVAARYDTTKPFNLTSSYQAINLYSAVNTSMVGFTGAVFDGRYVTFTPYADYVGYSARITRFDTTQNFTTTGAWSLYDAGPLSMGAVVTFFGAAFDGRRVHFGALGAPMQGTSSTLVVDTATPDSAWELRLGSASENGRGSRMAGPSLMLSTAGGQRLLQSPTVLDGAPHHLAGSVGADGVATLFVDGQPVATASAAVPVATTLPLRMGGFHGELDEAALWQGPPSIPLDDRTARLHPADDSPNHHGTTLSAGRSVASTEASLGQALELDTGMVTVPSSPALRAPARFTVEARVQQPRGTPRGALEPILERWGTAAPMRQSDVTSFDLTALNPDAKGMYLGCFDGKHVYMAPYAKASGVTHGQAVRVDVTRDAYDATTWETVNIDGIVPTVPDTTGFFGCISDGTYVYYVPYYDVPSGSTGRILRYDTRLPFASPTSWAGFDAAPLVTISGLTRMRGMLGGTFDGRYVYFTPHHDGYVYHARVLRLDTRGDFTSSSSWQVFDANARGITTHGGYAGAVFDGRYVHFVPNYDGTFHATFLRYDTTEDFGSAEAWQAYVPPQAAGTRYVTGVFDGRYVFFVPFDTNQGAVSSAVLRFDTHQRYTSPDAWESHAASGTRGLAAGQFHGAAFDGRFIYFVPLGPNLAMVRYDTHAPFHDVASWDALLLATGDATRVGFAGAVFDGRYVHFIPHYNGAAFVSTATRLDTASSAAAYSLRWHHQPEWDALVTQRGPTAILQTTAGRFTVSAPLTPDADPHHVAMRFDGDSLDLFLDGAQVGTTLVTGTIPTVDPPVRIGGREFRGVVDEVAIWDVPLDASELAQRAHP